MSHKSLKYSGCGVRQTWVQISYTTTGFVTLRMLFGLSKPHFFICKIGILSIYSSDEKLEITHIKFPGHLINGNFYHPQPRVKAPKHTKAAMPISYFALPFHCPFKMALKK